MSERATDHHAMDAVTVRIPTLGLLWGVGGLGKYVGVNGSSVV
jgi:hypothetical protein